MGVERYNYQCEVAVRQLGPGAVEIGQEVYRSDETRTYIQITLLHSYPKVNLNGATLLPPLLTKIIPTADNQPLNMDHQMEGNPDTVYQGTDLVVGTMIKAYLATEGEISLFPDEPIAAKVIGVLWNRVALAQKIIQSIGQKEKQYRLSFEIPRDVSEDGFVILGADEPSYKPISSASKEEIEAWGRKEYDKIVLAVGGDGSGNSANIYGGAFTLTPADEDAEINAILTGSFKGQTAIAAHIKSATASAKTTKEVTTMPLTAIEQLNTAIAQGGVSIQVTGNDLVLTLGENVIKNPLDFYLSRWTRGDGEAAIHASMEIAAGGIDGFKEMKRLEYVPDAESEAESLSLVEEGSEKVKTPLMYEAQIASLVQTIKDNGMSEDKIRAEFAGFISPDDHEKALADAVAKALTDAGQEKTFTEEEVETKAREAVEETLAARDAADKAATMRGDKLEEEGLILTAERKLHIATIAVGDEGDAAFKEWLSTLKANQETMAKDLKNRKIEVTDQVKAALAHIDDKASSGYAVLIAAHGGIPASMFSPSMLASGDGGNGEEPNSVMGTF